MYRIDIFDATGTTRYAVLGSQDLLAVTLSRAISEADELTFRVRPDCPDRNYLIHGLRVRLYRDATGEVLSEGIIAGDIIYGPDGIDVRADGLAAILAREVYPPGYTLHGDLATIKHRMVQGYDIRRVTAKSSSVADGVSVCVFDGFGAGNWLAAYSNTICVEAAETGGMYESAGTLMLVGTGTDNSPPYASGGYYDGPLLDFLEPPAAWDRLRFVGSWQTPPGNPEVWWAFAALSNASDPKTFSFSQAPVDPEVLGEDISGYTPTRYCAVRFLFYPTDPLSYSPAVYAYEVIARRALGIVAGSFPAAQINNLEVGGQTLLAAIDGLCQAYGWEWRVIGSTLHVQPIPAPGQPGAAFGADMQAEYYLAEGVSCQIDRLVLSDERMVNNLWGVGEGANINAILVSLRHAGSQGLYGRRTGTIVLDATRLDSLRSQADAYLQSVAAPYYSAEVTLIRDASPAPGTDIAPGDIVRLYSAYRTDVAGNPLSLRMRVIRDRRELRSGAEIITLTLDTAPPPASASLARDLHAASMLAGDNISDLETGEEWLGPFNDNLPHAHTVVLDFTPDRGSAQVLEVYLVASDTYYTAHGSPVHVEVAYTRVGRNRFVFAVRRTQGTEAYSARVAWQVWGRTSATPLGGKRRR